MTRRRLFDVVLEVSGDDDTGAASYEVAIVDRYDAPGHTPGDVIAWSTEPDLDAAMRFARGAVTAFMNGTQA